MLDPTVKSAVDDWLADSAIADTDKAEVRALVDSADEQELKDRFYQDLEFGTGGMRGIIGAGRNRMNLYTVGAAAQGLANYLVKTGGDSGGAAVAIAFDCRRMSQEFARRVACVLAANRIRVFLFEALRPTPELSFTVRKLGCTAGIVITASHNPPEYNGLKAYWCDGGQVVPPHDAGIIAEVRRVGPFSNIKLIDEQTAVERGLLVRIGESIDEAFLSKVDDSCLCPEISRKHGKTLKIVFTPLHGTGHRLVPEALRRRGFRHVLVEPAQSEPNGEFPTVKSPNPEESAALEMGIALARRERADLVIATDPDADRAGIAVRRADGEYELLTGNQIGALLTYFICEQLTAAGRFPERAVVLSTIVSSDLAKEIARSYGAEVMETLTGFKWIAAKIREFEEAAARGEPLKTFIFGMEESYGYLPCTFARDKDAVTSCAFIADAAAFAAERGMTLHEMLADLFKRFGCFREGAMNITMRGKHGADQIKAVMHALRTTAPQTLGGAAVISAADLLTGIERRIKDGAETKCFDLPASDVLIFSLAGGTKVIARPSGTEPKIKFYILTRSTERDLPKAHAACTELIRSIESDLSRLIDAAGAGR